MTTSKRTISFPTRVHEDLVPAWLWASVVGLVGTLAWFGNVLGFWQTTDQALAIQRAEKTCREQTFAFRKEQRRAEAYAAGQTLIERRLPVLPALDFPRLGDGQVKVNEVADGVWRFEGAIKTFDRWGRTCTPTYQAELVIAPSGEWKLAEFIIQGLPRNEQPSVHASL